MTSFASIEQAHGPPLGRAAFPWACRRGRRRPRTRSRGRGRRRRPAAGCPPAGRGARSSLLIDERIGLERLGRRRAARLAHEAHVVEVGGGVDPLEGPRQRTVERAGSSGSARRLLPRARPRARGAPVPDAIPVVEGRLQRGRGRARARKRPRRGATTTSVPSRVPSLSVASFTGPSVVGSGSMAKDPRGAPRSGRRRRRQGSAAEIRALIDAADDQILAPPQPARRPRRDRRGTQGGAAGALLRAVARATIAERLSASNPGPFPTESIRSVFQGCSAPASASRRRCASPTSGPRARSRTRPSSGSSACRRARGPWGRSPASSRRSSAATPTSASSPSRIRRRASSTTRSTASWRAISRSAPRSRSR